MSELSGSLADFDLQAVVRLLAAGSKTGILVVHGARLDGSLFFNQGELTYATTRRNTASPESTDGDRREGGPDEPKALIVDVAARLMRQEGGSFTFQADVHPVHTVEETFDAEDVLGDLGTLLEAWDAIDESLGSTRQPYAMTRDVDNDETIELKGREWNVLTALESGRSAIELADRLRQPELETAQMLVRLKEDGLVEATEDRAPEPARTAGGRLIEPDRDDLVVDLTGRSVPGSVTFEIGDEEPDAEMEEEEEPASGLAARWRTLRSTSREELLDSQ